MSRNANGSSGICKNVLKLEDVNSAEFDETTKNPVIHIMEEQKGIDKKGGTMRLGAYPCLLKEESLAYKLYGKKKFLKDIDIDMNIIMIIEKY